VSTANNKLASVQPVIEIVFGSGMVQVMSDVLKTSLGNQCIRDWSYSNPFDCPATCMYSPDKARSSLCNHLSVKPIPANTCHAPCKVSNGATEEEIRHKYSDDIIGVTSGQSLIL
jgi:hypothetical protein